MIASIVSNVTLSRILIELRCRAFAEDLRHACLLVLANKQDIQGSRNAGEIAQDLSLHKILTHEWQIQSCCALTGAGLREGLSWIAGRIKARSAFKAHPKDWLRRSARAARM